jgi:hypothetical protein
VKRYRMPDGRLTDNPDRYAAAWQELGKPWTNGTTLTLFGFDPGLAFQDKASPMLMNVPTHIALALYLRLGGTHMNVVRGDA